MHCFFSTLHCYGDYSDPCHDSQAGPVKRKRGDITEKMREVLGHLKFPNGDANRKLRVAGSYIGLCL